MQVVVEGRGAGMVQTRSQPCPHKLHKLHKRIHYIACSNPSLYYSRDVVEIGGGHDLVVCRRDFLYLVEICAIVADCFLLFEPIT